MKFLRYRQKFASGYGQWEYSFLRDKECLKEELHQEYHWSDKYRGCDIEDVDQPPKEWIERQIESAKQRISWATQTHQELTEYLKTYETEIPTDDV